MPSLFMTMLALSACQNSSSTGINSQDKESTARDTRSVVADDKVADNKMTMNETTTDKQTAEQQMINNLSRYRWTLNTATDSNSEPVTLLTQIKDQVTLNFSQHQGQNMISYSVGCNTMDAAYQLQGSTLTTEDSMSTKMSCGDLDVAENLLNELMQAQSQLSLIDANLPMLTQVTDNAVTLVWRGRMTALAKYNIKGETLFWAVSADQKPCTNNSTKRCLQIKPITYDDQGIKTDEGAWTEFTGSIDGYQHDSNTEEVLRLQRYKLDNEDTNSANDNTDADIEYAYVLDMVISKAIVK